MGKAFLVGIAVMAISFAVTFGATAHAQTATPPAATNETATPTAATNVTTTPTGTTGTGTPTPTTTVPSTAPQTGFKP